MGNVEDGSGRDRRRLTRAVRTGLRDLNIQLVLLSRQVSTRVGLKDVDWDCLDLLNRHGPLGPSALAHKAGVHPATMTGVLDRLQRAGWITRERDPDATDRRAVSVHVRPERARDLYRLFSGMNARVDGLCEEYTEAELELIVGFLRRTTDAGRDSADQLAGD